MTADHVLAPDEARAAHRVVVRRPAAEGGRIPYARTVLLMQLVAALVFVGYTMAKKGVQLPFAADPFVVHVMLPDAKGLDPAKGPPAIWPRGCSPIG